MLSNWIKKKKKHKVVTQKPHSYQNTHWNDLNNKDKSSLARREFNGLDICFVQVACGLSYFKHHFLSLHNTCAICYTLGAFQTRVISSALTLLRFEGISHNLTPLKWQNVHKSFSKCSCPPPGSTSHLCPLQGQSSLCASLWYHLSRETASQRGLPPSHREPNSSFRGAFNLCLSDIHHHLLGWILWRTRVPWAPPESQPFLPLLHVLFSFSPTRQIAHLCDSELCLAPSLHSARPELEPKHSPKPTL